MIMIMESYDHHEPPRAVRGSIGGCSMDMWCPYDIGRESWDWEAPEGIGLTPSPEKGDFPIWGGGASTLDPALPYPSFPALCRKGTTYQWSYRLRSASSSGGLMMVI